MFTQQDDFTFVHQSDEAFFADYDKGDTFVVALDFDGVFTDHHQTKADALNKAGYNLTPDQTSRKYCLEVAGMSLEDYMKHSLYGYIEMLPDVPLEEQVQEVFAQLRAIPQVRIYVVTSRYGKDEGLKRNSIPAVEAYLRQHGLKVDGLFNTEYEPKREILAQLGADVFVDDTPSKLYELFDDPKVCTSIDPRLQHCKFFLFRNAGNIAETEARGKTALLSGWPALLTYVQQQLPE